jgi:dTDP-4-dehydrorhamnose 3,5-epimerase
MNFIKTEIPEVVIIEPKVWGDERGHFFESYRYDFFEKNIRELRFVQDNESKSGYGVLRGLHYQLPPFAQSKLVRVIQGIAWDVAVDIRRGSSTFGKYVGVELSGDNKKMLFIPRGFAHGFIVLSDDAILSYKVDSYYSKEYDRGIIYNDPVLNIDWKIKCDDIKLSDKDRMQPLLKDADIFEMKETLYV